MVKVKKDLTGMIFGKLTVLEQSEDYIKPDGEHCAMWKCMCSCGNIAVVKGDSLKSGMTHSCGCYRKDVGGKNTIDLVGRKFGRLTVLERADDYVKPDGKRDLQWLCECECGNKIITLGRSLKSGGTQSCGCLRKEKTLETPRPFTDLSGKVFGKLTVIDRAENKNGIIYWNCLCECGNMTCVASTNLKRNHVRSCGCLKHDTPANVLLKNLIGETFGELTVVERAPSRKGATYWKCVCSCGNETVVASTNLIRGSTMSCGCLSQSRGELKITEYLEENHINFESQKRFDDCRDKKPLPFDFYLPDYNICIEYDGRQHFEPVNFAGDWQETKNNYELTNKHDNIKTQYCKDKNMRLIRIPYTKLNSIEMVLSENLS